MEPDRSLKDCRKTLKADLIAGAFINIETYDS